MLEKYLQPARVATLRSRPLGLHIESFANLLEQARYTPSTIRIKLRLLADLDEWWQRSGRAAAELDQRGVTAFLAARRRRYRHHRVDKPTLRHFLEHLQRQGVIAMRPVEVPDETPVLKLERRYEGYLRKERGMNTKTIRNHRALIGRFLIEHFGKESLRLEALQASDISMFIIKHRRHMGPKYAQAMVTALRSFLRFLLLEGEIATDLTGSVPMVRCWRNTSLPKYLSDVEVEQILASCDRKTPTGRRNYAMLLLLARLGLRAGEVARLQLDDIDWRAGEIHVLGKGQVRGRLPLLPEIGQALATYLRRDRPRSSCRYVFLRAIAPRQSFVKPSSISTIVSRAIERAGLQPPFKGAHIFRHSLATKLLRRGASLEEIAEILRHRNTATTEIYAKVDIRSLRALARPWVEIGSVK